MAAKEQQEIRVIAQAIARPDELARVRSVLKDMVVPTRAEKGCITYDLQEVIGDPYRFMFFEIWESEAALEDHTQKPHFQRLIESQTLMAVPLKVIKLKRTM